MEENIILFGPSNGKSLKKMYPEIASEPLFKELNNEEVLFAWYVGCKSSPIDQSISDSEKYKQAAAISFKTDREKMARFSVMDVTENVKLAIEKMETYSPKAREIATQALQNHFKNIIKLSEIDIISDTEYKDKEGNSSIDWTARKQYSDIVKTHSEILPNLIKQVEEGFGIEKTKKEETGTRAIDKYHNSKKDKR